MLEIFDGHYLDDDLAEMPDADLIDAFLSEVEALDKGKWVLTRWDDGWHNPHFNVKAISFLQGRGYNIYRIRPLSRRLQQYRILYAYDNFYDQFYILAVVRKRPLGAPTFPRDDTYFDYETDHPIIARICREYDSIGIPRV